MELTDDLKLENLKNKIADLTLTYLIDVEQITLDFLESAEYKLDKVNQDSLFDTELTLNEIKGDARKFIKSQTSWESDVDVKILNKILQIEYKDL